jgi:predicted metalloprotease
MAVTVLSNVNGMITPKKIRWAGHVTRMRERGEMHYRSLVGRPEGKRSFERPKSRWEDNIKCILKEMKWEGVG